MSNPHKFLMIIDEDILSLVNMRAGQLGLEIRKKAFPLIIYVRYLIIRDLETCIDKLGLVEGSDEMSAVRREMEKIRKSRGKIGKCIISNTHKFLVTIKKELLPLAHKRCIHLGLKSLGKVLPLVTYAGLLIEKDLKKFSENKLTFRSETEVLERKEDKFAIFKELRNVYKKLTTSEQKVLDFFLSLIDDINDTTDYIGYDKVVKETGLARSTVAKSITSLIKKGFMLDSIVEGNKGRKYSITFFCT